MIFALGFLAAILAALLMLPILNRRSARLARRRIEGLFPTSMQEIAAERDALRAEFAVAQVRLTRRVEAARTRAGVDRQAAGARVLEIAALERVVEGRDALLAARGGELDEAFARIGGLDRDLSVARSEGVASLAALTALEDAHREILIDLKSVRRERDGVRRDLEDALIRTEQAGEAGPKAFPTGPEEEDAQAASLADLRARHAALTSERDGLKASLNAAEDALAGALAANGARKDHELERGHERDDAELRRRIAEVAEALTRRDRLPAVGTFPLPAAARP